jgi:hypothetical protein
LFRTRHDYIATGSPAPVATIPPKSAAVWRGMLEILLVMDCYAAHRCRDGGVNRRLPVIPPGSPIALRSRVSIDLPVRDVPEGGQACDEVASPVLA